MVDPLEVQEGLVLVFQQLLLAQKVKIVDQIIILPVVAEVQVIHLVQGQM
tara:strand:+ start:372 stop:521 length:150 start_codon:yes stop_codon:yes gene_type:complete